MRTLSLILILLTACGDASESIEPVDPVDCGGLDDVTCAEALTLCGQCPDGLHHWYTGERFDCVGEVPCPCDIGEVCVDGWCESSVCR